MNFQSVGRSSNFATAGNAAADDTLKSFLAARRNSPNYGQLAERAASYKSAEKVATIKAEAKVEQAGIAAKAKVKADKYEIDGKSAYASAKRKAGAVGLAGKMFASIGTAGGDEPIKPFKGGLDYGKIADDLDAEAAAIRDGLDKPSTDTSTSTPKPSGGGSPSTKTSPSVSTTASKPTSNGGSTLTIPQMTRHALNAGFSPENAKIMAAVGFGESGGRTSIDTSQTIDPQKKSEYSIGIFQINAQAHGDKLRKLGYTEEDLRDPAKNAQVAKLVYDEVGGFTPWTVYKDNKHLQYLQ